MKLDMNIFWKGVDEKLLQFFQKNPDQFHKLDDIAKHMLDNEPLLHTWEVIMRCFLQHGIKGKLLQGIQRWQNEEFPIISSNKKGQGYMYLNYDNPDAARYWDSKLKANKTRREITKGERENDGKNLIAYRKKCHSAKLRQELEMVAIKYRIKK